MLPGLGFHRPVLRRCAGLVLCLSAAGLPFCAAYGADAGLAAMPAFAGAETALQVAQAPQAHQASPAHQSPQANRWPSSPPAHQANTADAALITPSAAGAGEAAAAGSKPAVLRGSLGDAQVQASLRPKYPAEDGIEGEYFVFGGKQHILLAGEIDGESLWMEESENGVDVSGQWEGTRHGDVVEGTWQSVDGSISKPFQLKIMP